MKARQQAALARRDVAKAGQAQAQAALSQARTSLDYTRIRAPFEGVVTEKKADSGTLASPGVPIFTVEDVRRYRLEATVNENDLHYVRTGEQVSVVIDALDNAGLKGKVVQIVPAADAASRTFLVKVDLPTDTHLRSGLFGRAQFSRGERQALLIPRSAVAEDTASHPLTSSSLGIRPETLTTPLTVTAGVSNTPAFERIEQVPGWRQCSFLWRGCQRLLSRRCHTLALRLTLTELRSHGSPSPLPATRN